MKIKELIKSLEKEDQEREIVLFDWNTTNKINEARFYNLEFTCDPHANSENMLVFRTTDIINPIINKRR